MRVRAVGALPVVQLASISCRVAAHPYGRAADAGFVLPVANGIE
jgi:hypothetical protein